MTSSDPEWQRAGTAARQACLGAPLRALHRAILTAFLDLGTSPSQPWLADQVDRLGLIAAEAFAELATTDLVHRDGAGDVSVAYPFCATPTSHRIEPMGGPPLWAMCAIDALGIPYMADRAAVISSLDPYTGDPVRIEMTNGTWTWHPAGAVVVVACAQAGGARSCCLCPHTNFHTEPATAAEYLQAHPGIMGHILDQPAALRIACLAFGPLLHPPRPTG